MRVLNVVVNQTYQELDSLHGLGALELNDKRLPL